MKRALIIVASPLFFCSALSAGLLSFLEQNLSFPLEEGFGVEASGQQYPPECSYTYGGRGSYFFGPAYYYGPHCYYHGPGYYYAPGYYGAGYPVAYYYPSGKNDHDYDHYYHN